MRKFILLFFLIGLMFSSCKKNRLKVDISEIKANLEIVRLETELFGREYSELADSVAFIRERIGDYFDLFTYEIIGIGGIDDEEFYDELKQFVNDTVYRRVAESVILEFSDFSKHKKKLEKAFRYYQYHFPEKTVPKIYTHMSGFNQSLIIDKDIVGISLEKYLGADCVYYQYLGIPAYLRRNMNPSKMITDIFYALAMVEYPFHSEKNHLLDHMIYHGKLIYFSEAMCTGYPDSIMIGFTQIQINWCKSNEALMWAYLAQNKLLYNSDRLNLRKYIGDGPNTSSFSSESPGRAVVWLGWQIVRSYMKNNPEISLAQLFESNDAQVLLTASGYYPDL